MPPLKRCQPSSSSSYANAVGKDRLKPGWLNRCHWPGKSSPVTRWNYEVNDQGDPLLWMESIPYWETRSYVAIVMRNFWMYERQARTPSPSRVALAQNAWPAFPSTEPGGGRVYLSAGAD